MSVSAPDCEKSFFLWLGAQPGTGAEIWGSSLHHRTNHNAEDGVHHAAIGCILVASFQLRLSQRTADIVFQSCLQVNAIWETEARLGDSQDRWIGDCLKQCLSWYVLSLPPPLNIRSVVLVVGDVDGTHHE